MAIQIQLRQGTTTEHNTFTGAVGELTYNTTLKSLVLHDGVTAGGVKIPYLSNGFVPSTMLPTATESVVGASKIATTAIAQAGTNNTDIITPLKLQQKLNTSILGMSQTTKEVTRVVNTEYTNATNKTIVAYFTIKVWNFGTSIGYCDGEEVGRIYCDVGSGGSVIGQIVITVPPNSKYKIIGGEIHKSSELS